MPIGYPISFCIKAGSVPEANEHIAEIKKKYPDAKICVEVNPESHLSNFNDPNICAVHTDNSASTAKPQ